MLNLMGPRVLLRRLPEKELVSTLLELVSYDDTPSNRGIVVGVGTGRLLANGERLPIPLKEGDKVICRKFTGADVHINGEALIVVPEEDIIAVLEDETNDGNSMVEPDQGDSGVPWDNLSVASGE